MSFRAYVAFKTESGYDVHHSKNGGQEYQLRQPLKQWAETPAAQRTAFDTPSSMPPAAESLIQTLQQQTSGTVDVPGPAPVVSPDPIETDVAKDDLFASIPIFDTEAVYIVEDATVRTFVPVSPRLQLLEDIQKHATVEFYWYQNEAMLAHLVEHLEETTPVGFDSHTFTPADVSALPEWARSTLKYHHRYAADYAGDVDAPAIVDLGGSLLHIRPDADTASTADSIPEVGIPIEVTWTNGVPSYPYHGRGAEPKRVASELRFDAFMDSHPLPDTTIPQTLRYRFGDDIAHEFVPSELSQH